MNYLENIMLWISSTLVLSLPFVFIFIISQMTKKIYFLHLSKKFINSFESYFKLSNENEISHLEFLQKKRVLISEFVDKISKNKTKNRHNLTWFITKMVSLLEINYEKLLNNNIKQTDYERLISILTKNLLAFKM